MKAHDIHMEELAGVLFFISTIFSHIHLHFFCSRTLESRSIHYRYREAAFGHVLI